jgi:alkaline phosphatase
MFRVRIERILVGCFVILSAGLVQAEAPRNVIFMVGDGMGLNHVQAAGMFLNGAPGTLSFESLPYQAQVMTYSADSSITDSAAAATAMATGNKVNNGVISMAYPGDGHELQSLLEFYKARGTRTGLVTTDTMTGATPAGFGAHEPDRNNTSQIAGDYLNRSKPTVLLGGGGNGISASAAIAAGYTVVTDLAGMQAINTGAVSLLSGQFGSGSMPYEYDGVGSLPHLRQMATTALDILDDDPDGFFVLIEGGNIDHAAHSNDLARDVYETVEFQNTVQVVLNWAAGRTDTLVVVTADHETGGMSVPQNNGKGNLPTVTWSTTGHTGANVGVWAQGVNAEYITGTLNNTQFFKIITNPDPTIVIAPPDVMKSVTWAHNLPSSTDSFTLQNSGLGGYSYTITSDASWVWAEPASGTCTTETDTIWLAYDVAALPPGPYVAHLNVVSNEAPNSPRSFTVNLTVKSVPGDFDSDRDVDQEDFGRLQACLSGTGPMAAECLDADLDGTGHIDQIDMGLLQRCLSGPGNLADPHCAD